MLLSQDLYLLINASYLHVSDTEFFGNNVKLEFVRLLTRSQRLCLTDPIFNQNGFLMKLVYILIFKLFELVRRVLFISVYICYFFA